MEDIIINNSIPKKKSNLIPTVISIIVGIILVYMGVQFFGKKETIKEPSIILQHIDSLKEEQVKLQEAQRKLDSANYNYDISISILDAKIDSIKEKTVIVKDHYINIIPKTRKYSPKEVDTFFKKRYNY
jgi:uncharacterized protein YacL